MSGEIMRAIALPLFVGCLFVSSCPLPLRAQGEAELQLSLPVILHYSIEPGEPCDSIYSFFNSLDNTEKYTCTGEPIWSGSFAGWPVNDPLHYGDLDGDGDLEVVCHRLSQSGLLAAFDPLTGEPLPGWPLYIGSGDADLSTDFVLADIDSDGADEIVIGEDDHFSLPGSHVWAYNADGT
ncbi:MAG: VCBS repeat-containing protein, partial [Planctomycetes bacterium]|nr:VCBS repeat-containing protein [Planctomycetota bacterium]